MRFHFTLTGIHQSKVQKIGLGIGKVANIEYKRLQSDSTNHISKVTREKT